MKKKLLLLAMLVKQLIKIADKTKDLELLLLIGIMTATLASMKDELDAEEQRRAGERATMSAN